MNTGGTFQCYGAIIETDIELADYLPAVEPAQATLRLQQAEAGSVFEPLEFITPVANSHGRSLTLSSDGVLGPSVPGQAWHFAIEGLAGFYWNSGQGKVKYRVEGNAAAELLPFWVIHIFVPTYLAIERVYDFIHASAVEIDGAATLFVAPTTGGKSTLSKYFTGQGHAFVSDDKVATFFDGDELMALPSHPHCRPYRKPEDLGPRITHFRSGPLRLSSLFILNRVGASEPVTISEISGYRKFDELAPNCLFGFTHSTAGNMEKMMALVKHVSMFTVDVPFNLERLPEVYSAICERVRV